MYARIALLGTLATMVIALRSPESPSFALHSSGAVALHAAGHEARYGVVSNAVQGRPVLMISLGATAADGAIQLTTLGDLPPAPGRYPVRSSWDALDADSTGFHASFMPGTVAQPLGWYHGDSGWVTITASRSGRITGSFEIRARGFSAADPLDEERWVSVQGTFTAAGDSTVAVAAN